MSRDVVLTLVPASGEPSGAPATPRRSVRRRIVLVGILLAMLIVTTIVVVRSVDDHTSALTGTTPVTASEMETRYGAKFGVVGLLAAGGLLELRFQVIDKDKAEMLFGHGDRTSMPRLVVDGSDTVLESGKGMAHKLTLLDGASYFLLYTNAANAVHEGSMVSVVINDVRLDGLVVQQ